MQQWSVDVNNSLAVCQKKKIALQTRYDSLVAEISKLKADIDSQTKSMASERDQMSAKFVEMFQEVNMNNI